MELLHQYNNSPVDLLDLNNNYSTSSSPDHKMEYRKKVKSCLVCGDNAFYYFYGAITCDSCRTFFRRQTLQFKPLKCSFNGKCVINNRTRKDCSKCRLNKCLEVGMRQDLIVNAKEERKRKQSINLIELYLNNKNSRNSSPNTSSVFGLSNNLNSYASSLIDYEYDHYLKYYLNYVNNYDLYNSLQNINTDNHNHNNHNKNNENSIDNSDHTNTDLCNTNHNNQKEIHKLNQNNDDKTSQTSSPYVFTSINSLDTGQSDSNQLNSFYFGNKENNSKSNNENSLNNISTSLTLLSSSLINNVYSLPIHNKDYEFNVKYKKNLNEKEKNKSNKFSLIEKSINTTNQPNLSLIYSEQSHQEHKNDNFLNLKSTFFNKISNSTDSCNKNNNYNWKKRKIQDLVDEEFEKENQKITKSNSSNKLHSNLTVNDNNFILFNHIQIKKQRFDEILVTSKRIMKNPEYKLNEINLSSTCQLIEALKWQFFGISKMCRTFHEISPFKDLKDADKRFLMMANCTYILFLSSIKYYNRNNQCWDINVQLNKDDLKEVKMPVSITVLNNGNNTKDLTKSYIEFIETFDLKWLEDEILITLVYVICLFTPNKKLIDKLYNIGSDYSIYLSLLEDYLEQKFDSIQEASSQATNLKLMFTKLTEFKDLFEKMHIVLDKNQKSQLYQHLCEQLAV